MSAPNGKLSRMHCNVRNK